MSLGTILMCLPFLIVPETHAIDPVVGIARTDANSRAAHLQLVEKAKKGPIKLYFVGDSITRRWGTSDPPYRDFLQNWKERFHGWNAGNFGWGGDTTRNILWRIQNGELDGVNPEAIVILAGTNDVGSGATADEVVAGIEAIVSVCLAKAPKATVVVTKIFPRNDNPAFLEVISETNRRLAILAKRSRVRLVDVNPLLTDSDGRLRESATVDGLHLSLEGYEAWGDALMPVLHSLLGRKSSVDYAPPPTGDPGIKD